MLGSACAAQDASGQGVSFCLDDVSVAPLPADARWALLPEVLPSPSPPPPPAPPPSLDAPPQRGAAAPSARAYVSYWADWERGGEALPVEGAPERAAFLRTLRREMAAWLAEACDDGGDDVAPPRVALLQAEAGRGDGNATLRARFALTFAAALADAEHAEDAAPPPRRTLLLSRRDVQAGAARAAGAASAAAERAAAAAAAAAEQAADRAAAALRDNTLPAPVGPLLRALGRARFSHVDVTDAPPNTAPVPAPADEPTLPPLLAPSPGPELESAAPAPEARLALQPPPPEPVLPAVAAAPAPAEPWWRNAAALGLGASALVEPSSDSADAPPPAPAPGPSAAAVVVTTTAMTPPRSREQALPPAVLVSLLALSAATAVAGVVFLCAGLAWWRSGVRLRAATPAAMLAGKGKARKGGAAAVALKPRAAWPRRKRAKGDAAADAAEPASTSAAAPAAAVLTPLPPAAAATVDAAALTRRIQTLRAEARALPAGAAPPAASVLALGDAFAALGRLSSSSAGTASAADALDAAAQFAEARACYARAAAQLAATGDAGGAAAALAHAATLPGAAATTSPRRRAGGTDARDTRAPPAERSILAPAASGARARSGDRSAQYGGVQ